MNKGRSLPLKLSVLFRQHGLDRTGVDTWSASAAEVTLVCNLQQSRFGSETYINIGYWLKGHDIDSPAPAVNKCDVVIRAEYLLATAETIAAGRGPTSWATVDDMMDVLPRILEVAKQGLTLSGLRQLYNSGELRYALVSPRATVEIAITRP